MSANNKTGFNNTKKYINTGANGKKPTSPIIWVLVGLIALLLVVLVFILVKDSGTKAESSGTSTTYSAPKAAAAPAAVTAAPTAHTHSWSPATCTRAARCTICGAEQGSALGHSWVAATSERPRYCSVCGEETGGVLSDTSTPTPAPVISGSKSDAVELFTENDAYSKRYTVAVSYSHDRDACETCVIRLRDNGYNAFLYEELNKSGYTILIGIFDTAQEAKDFAEYLHNQPEVRGVSLGSAYALSKVRLSDSAASQYSSPWY